RTAGFRRSHLVGPSPCAPTGSCRVQAGFRAFGNEFALELGEGREDPEDQLALSRGRIDRRALPQLCNSTPRGHMPWTTRPYAPIGGNFYHRKVFFMLCRICVLYR